MNTLRKIFACVVSASVLAGCSVLTGRHEESAVYSLALAQATTPEATSGAHRWQLGVSEPAAIAPLDGARILVMPAPGEIQVYRGARWRDAAPAMLQQLMLQAFQRNSNTIAAAPATGVHADFLLRSDLQDFQAEMRGGSLPQAVVRLAVQLVRSADGKVVAARSFQVQEDCRSARIEEISAGFQRATDKLLAEMVAWVVAAGDAVGEPEQRATPG